MFSFSISYMGLAERCKLLHWSGATGLAPSTWRFRTFYRLTKPLLASILLILNLSQWNFVGFRAIALEDPTTKFLWGPDRGPLRHRRPWPVARVFRANRWHIFRDSIKELPTAGVQALYILKSIYSVVTKEWKTTTDIIIKNKHKLEIWANAQRDGRPVEYRWRLCSTPQSLADAH